MRKTIDLAGFQSEINKISTGEVTTATTYATNSLCVVGYKYEVMEYDYSLWAYTGRSVVCEVLEIFTEITSPSLTFYQCKSITDSYLFFNYKVLQLL